VRYPNGTVEHRTYHEGERWE